MVSDNSKEAAKTLERMMQDKEVQQHLAGVSQEAFYVEENLQGNLNYDELLTAVMPVEMIIIDLRLFWWLRAAMDTLPSSDWKKGALSSRWDIVPRTTGRTVQGYSKNSHSEDAAS